MTPAPTALARRCAFWLLLAVFAGLCLWYAFFFPYDPVRLWRAIPPQARWTVEIPRLAESWPALLRHRGLRAAAAAYGWPEAQLERLAADREAARLVRRLASERTLIAYVPRFGRWGQPALVAASWVGGESQILKMQAALHLLPGLRRLRLDGGREAWEWRPRGLPPGQRVSMALVEGVFLACVSPDPRGVQQLIFRLETGAPAAEEGRQSLPSSAAPAAPADSSARLWIAVGGEPAGADPRRRWRIDLTWPDADRLEGRLLGLDPPPGSPRAAAERAADLAPWIGNFPGAMLAFPYAWLQPRLGASATGVWEYAAAFLRTNVAERGSVRLYLSDTNHSGRLFGFRAPVVLAGVPLADPAAARGMIGAAFGIGAWVCSGPAACASIAPALPCAPGSDLSPHRRLA